jgi:anti-sigma regulatory factor (Ser/Thr protein kinase)
VNDVVGVRLLGLPVDVYRRSQQHHDELLREFSLIVYGEAESTGAIPARLLTLTEEIRTRYGSESAESRQAVDQAEARGEPTVDLTVPVPSEAGPAMLALTVLLDEADAFCRQGGGLLTMATPPDLRAFREWMVAEIVEQLAGADPRPWTARGAAVDEAEQELDLPADPASASEARRFVRRVLESWDAEALEDPALLLTSELVTNALLYARTPMKLRLRRRPGLVRVEVADEGAGAPVRRRYNSDASTGRGLALVEALADDWGVEPDNGGKRVWFTLPHVQAS